MSSSTQSYQFPNIAATTPAFSLKGGTYGLTVSATFGGGSVQLQVQSLDGSTWINAGAAIVANGFVSQALPPGTFRLAITTAVAVYAALTSVPT
jgi:hypothetical protein